MSLTARQLDVLEAVRAYRQNHRVSPTLEELGDRLGVSRVTVLEHLRALERKGAVVRRPNEARGIELNREWLEEWRSEFADEADQGDGWGADPAAPAGAGLGPIGPGIPLRGRIAAGSPIEAVEDDELDLAEMLPSAGTATYALLVEGDSMVEEGIRDGDYVIVEKRSDARDGDLVVAVLPEEEATLKRLHRDGGRWRLQPANAAMEPIWTDELEVRGVVRAVFRSVSR